MYKVNIVWLSGSYKGLFEVNDYEFEMILVNMIVCFFIFIFSCIVVEMEWKENLI